MAGRIVEISGEGRSLHLERGFLTVRAESQTIGKVPLDDIDAVIGTAHGLMWSNNILTALAERAVPVVLLGRNFSPVAHIISVAAHHEQGTRFQAQADAKKSLRNRLWTQIIKAKISAQAEMLQLRGHSPQRLQRLKKEVLAGDTSNREAIAAQHYWRQIMPADFRRDRGAEGANAMLNYGYAVLRAAAARAVLSAGLHPSLSLHHESGGDGLRLADDLMEPFRPTIDLAVCDLLDNGASEVDREVKIALGATLQADFLTENGRSPLSHVLVRQAQSLASVFLGDASTLLLPKKMLPCARELDLWEPEDA